MFWKKEFLHSLKSVGSYQGKSIDRKRCKNFKVMLIKLDVAFCGALRAQKKKCLCLTSSKVDKELWKRSRKDEEVFWTQHLTPLSFKLRDTQLSFFKRYIYIQGTINIPEVQNWKLHLILDYDLMPEIFKFRSIYRFVLKIQLFILASNLKVF